MVLKEKDGVKFLTFESLEGVGHCFSTRVGGVSEGYFSALNLGFSRGDPPERVLENYVRLGRAAGFNHENMVWARQTHGVNICRVSAKGMDYGRADGLLADTGGVVLVTFHADCAPIFFYDPINNAVGLAHAGWRGTLGEIGRKVVEEMARHFGSRAGDILAGIGPAIGPCCFEVDAPVAEAFMRLPFAGGHIRQRGLKFNIDLWALNRESLLRAGVGGVEVAGLCTKCQERLFFSHRRSGCRRGSMAAFIWL
ncbi:MAG: peptidoglycan editing factor PgeF [Clostridiales bacterium]|jgi:YfiH family protein|nr:peptidoglycan editing factor PgeF [Clostridiales bacterium]